MRALVSLTLLFALISGGCSMGDAPGHGGARTYYESLDLSSPRAGAETFVDAFGADDFMTVFLVLDLSAQDAVRTHVSLLQWDRLLRTGPGRDIVNEIVPVISLETAENLADTWSVFDQIMLIADRSDAFLIDLSEPSSLRATDSDDVIGEFAGVAGPVVIRMTESPSGRWRVHSVIPPGGDESLIPWSVADAEP